MTDEELQAIGGNLKIPQLPAGSRVLFNSLYDTKDPRCLTDDLYAAILPGQITVDVGWFPECDPSGSYELVFSRDEFENIVAGPFEIADLDKLVSVIEHASKEFVRQ